MNRALAIMFVTVTLLASPAAARGFGRGSPMGFAPHPGFVHPGFFAHPGFFPHRNFVNNRFFFRGFFVGPGIAVAPYPASIRIPVLHIHIPTTPIHTATSCTRHLPDHT